MIQQTQRSESDVKAQVARVKERRMSQIGFEEVNPSELEFGGKIGEGVMIMSHLVADGACMD